MSDKQFHSKSILHKIWGKIPKLTVRHYPKFSFWELNSHFTVWNSQPARLSPPILFLNSKFLVSKSMFIKLQDNLYRQFQFFLTDYIKIYKKKRTKVLFLNTEKEKDSKTYYNMTDKFKIGNVGIIYVLFRFKALPSI